MFFPKLGISTVVLCPLTGAWWPLTSLAAGCKVTQPLPLNNLPTYPVGRNIGCSPGLSFHTHGHIALHPQIIDFKCFFFICFFGKGPEYYLERKYILMMIRKIVLANLTFPKYALEKCCDKINLLFRIWFQIQ